ncbi:MAG: GxxExxY protein [Pelobacteraceae bacterium]
MNIEELGNFVIGAAIKVHRALGPGLLESAYQKCLDYELRKMGLRVECELALPIQYEAVSIDAGYRIDMIVEEMIIIENKTVERLLPIHEAQLLTYLKMRGCRLGYLLNWNVPMLRDGIKRLVNNL